MIPINGTSRIQAAILRKGYVLFQNAKGYDLNLFGIRTNNVEENTFNDIVGVMYFFDGRWSTFLFPATTDPGLYYLSNPMNVDGTAILKPGQYRGAYQIGLHKGYTALVQAAPLPVYRDDDRDGTLDFDETTVQTGMFGINIHRASSSHPSTQVDKWSAGCQVVQDPLHFDFLMSLAQKAADIYGNSFTYTLLTENDLD